ncbi:optic atrophy 3 protein-domain-containing protein [Panaeolus papilionaceus]|nr:optic atrophy 3 protein-domain-containing protein [Panaeolus papilionaceus]
MASVKLATLIIRTVAKPISNKIKEQARQHERFRTWCVDLAQFMYRSEVKLRHNILGEPAKLIRPLSETKAIDNGANAIAEGFLFSVAAALIIGETWRTSRNQSKRRDSVDDQLEDLGTQLAELTTRVDNIVKAIETEQNEERQRNDELSRILERIVEIGLRGGWAEFTDTPIQLPRVNLAPHTHPTRIVAEGPDISSPTISLLAKPGQGHSAALNGTQAADTKTSISAGNPTESS